VERCVSCQYYDRQNGRGIESRSAQAGLCRRSAPALNQVNAKTYMVEGIWPTVRDDDWCGEWKALVRRVDPARMSEGLSAVSSRMPEGLAAARTGAVNLLTPLPGGGQSVAAAASAFTRTRAAAE
jgi:hypothetical protein